MPYVEIKALYDDYAEVSAGWSFIQDHRNSWPVNGERWTWDRLFNQQASQLIESSRGTEVQCKTSAVESYFRQVRRFKKELIVLVYLSGGAPAQATELISIQHQNGQHSQGQRGVFIQDGMAAFVTQYHKGYSASKRIKVVRRFVPREVSEVVVYYLCLTTAHSSGSPSRRAWMEGEIDGEEAEAQEVEEEAAEQDAQQEWSEDEEDEWLADVPAQREE
ncbi:hypothetical protein LTR49_028508 [Elasticomyces elasticus]|nr:hypothetical protein LTR49_028508 [Elasticomyces elasticus]